VNHADTRRVPVVEGRARSTPTERIKAIEDAFVAHWSVFGRWSCGTLHDSDGVLWFETPIAHLPYNMVMRTSIPSDADDHMVVARVAKSFRDRGVPFLWVLRPSDRPEDLSRTLARAGLDRVETIAGMDLELAEWVREDPNPDVEIALADHDPDALREYVELIRTYWSVSDEHRALLEMFNREYSGDRAPGRRLVARVDGESIGKLFLNTSEAPLRVGVYGVSVKPEGRGRGIATALMTRALDIAAELETQRCVLHSSEMAVTLYRRMGFAERCTFSVYATAPLYGTHQH
jgi:ribosomal protein S18 acetylase RimI-like enzyme